jgi:hypothetical protein
MIRTATAAGDARMWSESAALVAASAPVPSSGPPCRREEVTPAAVTTGLTLRQELARAEVASRRRNHARDRRTERQEPSAERDAGAPAWRREAERQQDRVS